MIRRFIHSALTFYRSISAELVVYPHMFRVHLPVPYDMRNITNITTIKTGNEIVLICEYKAPNEKLK